MSRKLFFPAETIGSRTPTWQLASGAGRAPGWRAAAEQQPAAEGLESSAEAPLPEADVLPVFYYNDLLVANPGDPIGLNLFEPRYQLMCRRMESDPRFLFMPNYEDYQCRVGDVGLVIKLSEMRRHPGNQGFGIRGARRNMLLLGALGWRPTLTVSTTRSSGHWRNLRGHSHTRSWGHFRAPCLTEAGRH